MEAYNPRLRKTILEIVDNQLRDNDPPETRETLRRLKREGCSEDEARELIAAVVVVEIHDVLKLGKEFNHKRFLEALSRLPKQPFDDDETQGG